MAHEVYLNTPSLPIGNADVWFVANRGNKMLGRLKVSKGGVEWQPKRKRKSGPTITWAKFADLMNKESF